MEEAQQRERTELEEEKEQFLRELKERLDREKKEVRSPLAPRGRPMLFVPAWLGGSARVLRCITPAWALILLGTKGGCWACC